MFYPKIVIFACDWSNYAVDTAGSLGIQYPSNVNLIRVPCTGRITPSFILESFNLGADGVLILACPVGDCHYVVGNDKCQKMIKETKEIMRILGIQDERLGMDWVSSDQGEKIGEVMTDFTKKIGGLGKSPLGVN